MGRSPFELGMFGSAFFDKRSSSATLFPEAMAVIIGVAPTEAVLRFLSAPDSRSIETHSFCFSLIA